MSDSSDHTALTWVIPSLMSAILALVGWGVLSINRLSETVAVVMYRMEDNSRYMKEVERRVHRLESFAVLKKKGYDAEP